MIVLFRKNLGRIKRYLMRNFGIPHDIDDSILQRWMRALSEKQYKIITEYLCETFPDEIIKLVENKSSGTFKYIGNKEVKVIIGAAEQRQNGWLATDIDKLNIVHETSWSRLFNYASIDRLLAEHVFEHLSLDELCAALINVYKFLKPGAALRIAVPDAFHPSRYYYNLVKPGGYETPYEHKIFLDHEVLARFGNEVGFDVRLLEYFDENGIFHANPYEDEDGAIQRCARNNCGLDVKNIEVMEKFYKSIPNNLKEQFIERKITYTSLIADLVKPINACEL